MIELLRVNEIDKTIRIYKNQIDLKQETKSAIIKLYENWANDKVIETELLPQSGSYREYIRLIGQKQTVLEHTMPIKRRTMHSSF